MAPSWRHQIIVPVPSLVAGARVGGAGEDEWPLLRDVDHGPMHDVDLHRQAVRLWPRHAGMGICNVQSPLLFSSEIETSGFVLQMVHGIWGYLFKQPNSPLVGVDSKQV
jgi:hypothetical protein